MAMGPCVRGTTCRRSCAHPHPPCRGVMISISSPPSARLAQRLRQHVVIHGDREMRAFVVELAEQRVDAVAAISRCSPLTVTRIASPRCRSRRAGHRPSVSFRQRRRQQEAVAVEPVDRDPARRRPRCAADCRERPGAGPSRIRRCALRRRPDARHRPRPAVPAPSGR